MEEAGVIQRVSSERSSLAVATTGAPKLLDRVRQAIRVKHYVAEPRAPTSIGFADTSSFTGSGIPEMGASEIAAFLTWLATNRRVSASTQNQELSAVLFLYRHVLHIEIGLYTHVVNRGPLGVRSSVDRL